mgnify:CR=1 FL=1
MPSSPRIDFGVAVTGEVLDAGADACRLQPLDVRARVPRDQAGVGTEAAHADHRVQRVAVDVRDRREVHVEPIGGQQVRAHAGKTRDLRVRQLAHCGRIGRGVIGDAADDFSTASSFKVG